jgi:hypothetical protein
MGASWAAYLVMANHFVLVDKAAQVVAIHGPLLVVEAAVIACLVLAFSRAGSRES